MADGTWDLAKLIEAMQRASDDVRSEVLALIQTHADRTVQRTRAEYPTGPTGNLRRAVSLHSGTIGDRLLVLKVRSSAPHVHLFEDGTKPRGNKGTHTRRGAWRGVMPAAGPIFVTAAIAERASLLAEAQAILDRPRELV